MVGSYEVVECIAQVENVYRVVLLRLKERKGGLVKQRKCNHSSVEHSVLEYFLVCMASAVSPFPLVKSEHSATNNLTNSAANNS